MQDDMMKYYKLIGQMQSIIAKADTLDEALQSGLREILENCSAEYAVLWYADEKRGNKIHPYYWICPVDFTSKFHRIGEGCVGRVYENQEAERFLDYAKADDPSTTEDFENISIDSMVCVPLSNKNERIGCIQIVSTEETSRLTEEDADVCEILAMMIALGIDGNSKLHGQWKEGTILMSARNITREFQNGEVLTKVLKGVNLDVYEGEFLVLLGESGCGKSTFLNIVGGMDTATSGQLTFMGRDMSDASQEELTQFRRDNIGFIFQNYNLMPNLNARQNIDLIGELVEEPMKSEDALNLVGLGDRMENYPSQLSGGQQQRVSIARALVKKPKLILADEPTAALDYDTSISVLSVLEEIAKTGTTMLMVTHNEEITRMADRVVRMRNGRMYEVTVNRHPAKATDLVW